MRPSPASGLSVFQPEGGWLPQVYGAHAGHPFQHTAARRRLSLQVLDADKFYKFQHTAVWVCLIQSMGWARAVFFSCLLLYGGRLGVCGWYSCCLCYCINHAMNGMVGGRAQVRSVSATGTASAPLGCALASCAVVCGSVAPGGCRVAPGAHGAIGITKTCLRCGGRCVAARMGAFARRSACAAVRALGKATGGRCSRAFFARYD